MRARLILICVSWLLAITAQSPSWAKTENVTTYDGLTIDILETQIEIRSSFSGFTFFVFGAVDCPEAKPDGPLECEVRVRIAGPPTDFVVREKVKTGGLWLNGPSQQFNEVPGFFAQSTTAEESAREAKYGSRTPISANTAFAKGLITERESQGLYRFDRETVDLIERRLFRAEIAAPANVPTGNYIVTVELLSKDKVLASSAQTMTVRKAGFEEFIFNLAQNQPLVYGVASLALALGLGFLSTRAFKS